MSDETEQKANDEDSGQPRKVDEYGSLSVTDHLKIFDPNTGEVFLNKRDS